MLESEWTRDNSIHAQGSLRKVLACCLRVLVDNRHLIWPLCQNRATLSRDLEAVRFPPDTLWSGCVRLFVYLSGIQRREPIQPARKKDAYGDGAANETETVSWEGRRGRTISACQGSAGNLAP